MRVLVLSNLYPPNVIGGYERLCFEVSSELAAQGHEITVLTSRYGGKIAEYPGQRILRELDLLTGPDIYTPFGGSQADRDAINTANLDTLGRVIAQTRPEVVFAWNLFFLDGSILTALEASAVRTVVMLTDNWLLVMRNPGFWTDFFTHSVLGTRPFDPPPAPGLRTWSAASRGASPGGRPGWRRCSARPSCGIYTLPEASASTATGSSITG
jgi:glycogen(starch) synthase